MSAKTKTGVAVPFGGIPRVDLLPGEIRDVAKGARQRGYFTLGVIVTLAAVVGASVFLSFRADEAERQLTAAQDETTLLLGQQAQYSEVRAIASMVDMIGVAQQAAGLTEIQWTEFIGTVQSTLPGEVTIVEFDISSATPLRPISPSTDPLIASRVATVIFTAESVDLPNVRQWLDALSAVPGFTDATPGTVQLNDSTGRYDTTITMGVNEDAWSDRFAPEDPDADADVEETDE
ncbi:hypothetical protein EV141_1917 [Microcella putealis]|uniref:Tfp pilus assembly protein PilN n=1 Tax=Microcella putealis TaxID=337005 RepID=A0A4Q7LQE1_9MICO|nr:hypothetical protein [Microcella putealis]RZS56453.1 hypothetical protein EV141_1917 [Microcella putealis]TQM27061.1 hypothetical protein BJ957_0484 [Microcella putealis]